MATVSLAQAQTHAKGGNEEEAAAEQKKTVTYIDAKHFSKIQAKSINNIGQIVGSKKSVITQAVLDVTNLNEFPIDATENQIALFFLSRQQQEFVAYWVRKNFSET